MTGKERRESSSSSGSGSSGSDSEEEDTKPSNDVVMTKYNMAAEIVNKVLKELIEAAKPGVTVRELCDLGDKRMNELVGNTFKAQKDVQKGISMPTCVSIDNCACHFSPLASEPAVTLQDGQMVKFDLGVHLDGYIAAGAHTIVIGATKENKVAGKKAKVILAAYNAMELVLRMLRPDKGFKNSDVTDEQKPKMEKCDFENYEVYAIDVLVSTGEGKTKPLDSRTTIYKRTDDFVYQLKMKASRAFFSEAQTKFGVMPFSLRHFEDEARARMGVIECERHGLLTPYQVLHEREGEFVAQFKTTAIITPKEILKVTGIPLDTSVLDCNAKIGDPELSGLLQEGLKLKKRKAARVITDKSTKKRKFAHESSKDRVTIRGIQQKTEVKVRSNGTIGESALKRAFLLEERVPIRLTCNGQPLDGRYEKGEFVYELESDWRNASFHLECDETRRSRPTTPMAAATPQPSRIPFQTPMAVDGDLVSKLMNYAWFYTKEDGQKRSAIPLNTKLAITYRHGENRSLKIGDEISLISYVKSDFIVPTKVIFLNDVLDLVVLQSCSDKIFTHCDLLLEAVEPKKGAKYIMMGYSVRHGGTNHVAFSSGIISSDRTPRVRYLASGGSFKGDSGGSCWNEDGHLMGMQVETEKVPHTIDDRGRPASPACGGRCAIVPVTAISVCIAEFLPPDVDIEPDNWDC